MRNKLPAKQFVELDNLICAFDRKEPGAREAIHAYAARLYTESAELYLVTTRMFVEDLLDRVRKGTVP